MAKKLTKRKAFNFLRSYFDVLNELEKDKDKLEFLLAIINKQFLDEDPSDLNFVVNLCYESQRHQIETSVNGWKIATKNTCLGTPPTPLEGTPPTPLEEEEEEEEEKVKEELTFPDVKEFLTWFNGGKNHYTGVEGKTKDLKGTDLTNFKYLNKTYTRKDFSHALKMMSKSEWVKENKMFTPQHFLRENNFTKYLNQEDTKKKVVIDPKDYFKSYFEGKE